MLYVVQLYKMETAGKPAVSFVHKNEQTFLAKGYLEFIPVGFLHTNYINYKKKKGGTFV